MNVITLTKRLSIAACFVLPTVFAANALAGLGTRADEVESGSEAESTVYETPYVNDFKSQDDFDQFTIIDANQDNTTWLYDSSYHRLYCNYNGAQAMDDWAITPAIKFEKGETYNVVMSVGCQSSSNPERFELKLGNAATAEAMTTEVIAATEVTSTITVSGQFSVEEDGAYYLGMHGISDADQYVLYFRSITIDDANNADPAAPTNVTAVANEDKSVTLTWDPVTTDIYGNPLPEDAKVTYTVYRPFEQLIAENVEETTYTDTWGFDGDDIIFTVTATCNNRTSAAASANAVTVGTVAPTVVDVPYLNEFSDSKDSIKGFTIINANEDAYEWTWESYYGDGYARITGNSDNAMDDWMVTPGVNLKAGATYTATFKAYCRLAGSTTYTERFEVKMGDAPTVEGMTSELIAATEIASTDTKTYSSTFTVDADGVYYIGFHAISDAKSYQLNYTSIEIVEGEKQEEDEVVNVTPKTPESFEDVESFPRTMQWNYTDGLYSNNASGNATVVDGNGKTIGSYKLTRSGDSLWFTFSDNETVNEGIQDLGGKLIVQVPEGTVLHKDRTAYPAHEIIYTIKAAEPTEPTDPEVVIPSDPTNVNVSYADGVATITWDPVTTDTNGNSIEGVTYNVSSSYYTVVAYNTENTTATDAVTDPGTYYYTVTACYNEQLSNAVISNKFTIEPAPESVPYSNTLSTYDEFKAFTAIDSNNDGGWVFNDMNNRTMIFSVSGAPKDDWLISPKFELTTDKEYTVVVEAAKGTSDTNEKLEMLYGDAASAEALVNVILEPTEVSATDYAAVSSSKFSVPSNGYYYIGIHAVSEEKGAFYLRNFAISGESAVKGVLENAAVYGGNGEIVAPAGAKVYDVNGVCYSTSGLKAGLYIVVADGKAYKVVVK
jgi:hypothetical protein